VTAKIQSITHTYPSDVDMILVGPTGTKSWLMSDVVGGTDMSNLNLTFDDAAATTISCSTTTMASGTYKPTDCTDAIGTDVFPAPAPTGPYTPSLAQFNGTDPAGGWSMYVRDDAVDDFGSIGGWSLTLLTGFTGSITVTDTLPAGATYVGAAGSGWNCTHLSGVVTCTRATLALGVAPGIAITVTAPATTGPITNTVVVGSNLSDSAPANNAAQFTTNLIPGGATHGVSLAPGVANLAGLPGAVVTYTLAVTNTGNTNDTFTVLVSGNAFGATSPLTVGPLGAGVTTTFDVVVTIPPATPSGTLDTANAKVTSQSDPTKFANSTLTTTVRFGVYLPIVIRQP
jgi:subtilisin-like proprotein convertase family protein